MDSDGDDGDVNDGDDDDNHDNDHDDRPTNMGFYETGGSVWVVGVEWKKMVGMP